MGGASWLLSLRDKPLLEARAELMQLAGVGPKVQIASYLSHFQFSNFHIFLFIVRCILTLKTDVPKSSIFHQTPPSGCRLHPPHVPRSTWFGSSRHPHAQHCQEVSLAFSCPEKEKYKSNSPRYLPHLAAQKTITAKVHKEVGEHFRSLLGPWAGEKLCSFAS